MKDECILQHNNRVKTCHLLLLLYKVKSVLCLPEPTYQKQSEFRDVYRLLPVLGKGTNWEIWCKLHLEKDSLGSRPHCSPLKCHGPVHVHLKVVALLLLCQAQTQASLLRMQDPSPSRQFSRRLTTCLMDLYIISEVLVPKKKLQNPCWLLWVEKN
jgi:hypothetical protein